MRAARTEFCHPMTDRVGGARPRDSHLKMRPWTLGLGRFRSWPAASDPVISAFRSRRHFVGMRDETSLDWTVASVTAMS